MSLSMRPAAEQLLLCLPAVSQRQRQLHDSQHSDEELEGCLQFVKIDIETGKPVWNCRHHVQFTYIAEDGRETSVEMNDPKSGNAWAKKTSTF